jgi:signal peptidase I
LYGNREYLKLHLKLNLKLDGNMVYLLIDDIIFLTMILLFLVVIYSRIVFNWNFVEKIKEKYAKSSRNTMVQNRIKFIRSQPIDKQKIIFEDMSILTIALLVIVLIGTKAIFFAAVISDSMSPTFNKNDIILTQNIDRKYNVGDIVMFDRPDTSAPVSHRIVSINDDGSITTAGDATKGIDWWKLKNEDIIGKVITFQGKPIKIGGIGKYFIVEDKNQKFGPFDYQTYYLFISVIKSYGYGIAIISILIYLGLTFRGNKMRQL